MNDIAMLLIRWIHAVAAVFWVGGGLFYLMVIRPAPSSQLRSGKLLQTIISRYGQLVKLSMGVLLLSGVFLAAQRLTEDTATVAYAVVLTIKVSASAWMFAVVLLQNKKAGVTTDAVEVNGRGIKKLIHANTSIIVGLFVFFLSDLLSFIVEKNLAE